MRKSPRSGAAAKGCDVAGCDRQGRRVKELAEAEIGIRSFDTPLRAAQDEVDDAVPVDVERRQERRVGRDTGEIDVMVSGVGQVSTPPDIATSTRGLTRKPPRWALRMK